MTTATIPYWFVENLEFKKRNNELLDRGNNLRQQAMDLNSEVMTFIASVRAETGITDLRAVSDLPQAKPYIEKMNQATFLKLQSESFFSRWLECLRCQMQTRNLDAIPVEWEVTA